MSPLATREVKNEGVRLDLVAQDPAPVEFEDVILQEDDRTIVRSTRRINELKAVAKCTAFVKFKSVFFKSGQHWEVVNVIGMWNKRQLD